ncbi:hypothetical protein [Dictyobacter arantiisoli]|uniref:PPM-type phosphatase domain-containing protein n=1 Tax=Dictyobacter arantiisoli TaxID=2014874 RepID=A0A5A5TF99_9CHLR|nr:hypothetical protein [Dictyobacter arantiisoli]GCF10250.1 hypothetical protein KDI_38140 [Dictyobacter arantiisoli]
MYAQVTRLQCWKSEHNEQSCEDALGIRLSEGLLAVADGVGTTLFSNIWARHLVDHFIETPLLSADPFEVEWWLRTAQAHFQQTLPALEGMPWNVLQKVQNEGSFSTLATIRVLPGQGATLSRKAQLLVFGDSCIFIRKAATAAVSVFPVKRVADFDQPPICLPSRLSAFQRYFQRGMTCQIEFEPGDMVILATDAVARWIVSAGGGHLQDQAAAFMAVTEQVPASWPTFIASCRAAGEMVDDDCTAVVVRLDNEPGPDGAMLGGTFAHRPAMRASRGDAFLQAVHNQNKEQAAILYGDGIDLEYEGIFLPLEEQEHARQVADALREVLQVLRRNVNDPQAAARIIPTWRKYAALLIDEPCADAVCKTLERIGVPLREAMAPAGTTMAIQLARPRSLHVIIKSQEQMHLEYSVRQAIASNRDEAIVEVYHTIQNSPHAAAIWGGTRESERQRIQLALQRDNERRRMQRAIASQRVEQIAISADLIGRDTSFLSLEEQQLVFLSCQFVDAWRLQDSRALLAAVAAILNSPYRDYLLFTNQEMAYIEQVRRQYEQQQQRALPPPAAATPRPSPMTTTPTPSMSMMPPSPTATTRPSTTSTVPSSSTAASSSALSSSMRLASDIPAISEYWFRKVCHVKRLYLIHWVYQKVSDAELEQTTLDDLVNAALIQEGIKLANRTGASVPLMPEMLLPDIFQAFKNDPAVNYATLLRAYALTDEQVKDILLMLLNRQLFEEYLLWEQSMQLQDWLEVTHGYDGSTFRQRLEQVCPWVVNFKWWRG